MSTSTRTVTERDVQEAWLAMPAGFQQTHPLPWERSWEAGQEWSAKVRWDCAAVIVPLLETATADLARGDRDSAAIIHREIRPFERLRRVLEAVEAQEARA